MVDLIFAPSDGLREFGLLPRALLKIFGAVRPEGCHLALYFYLR